MISIIEHFSDFFLGLPRILVGKMEHQGGAFLAGKQSHNVQRPIRMLQSEIIYAF